MSSQPAHSSNTHGRELALLVLCHLESYVDRLDQGLSRVWASDEELPTGASAEIQQRMQQPGAKRFAKRLVGCFVDKKPEIDEIIEKVSNKWRLDRMGQVDRNLMRLAAVELSMFSTPRPVVLAEAVRMAAQFGNERSATFVNGIVESLAREIRNPQQEGKAGDNA